MTNDQKVKESTPAVPEVQGIDTAINGISSVKERLTTAILNAGRTEAELTKYRADLSAMPSGLNKAFLVEHQAELEAKIATDSRKAVSEALKEVQMHISTVQNLASQIQAKHGMPVVTTKRADRGNGLGNITASNMDKYRSLLIERGYTDVSVNMLDDSYHREITGKSPSGVVRVSRYTSNIDREWY